MAGRIARLLKPGRLRCSVPGCHCTTNEMARDGGKLMEWVCQKHWRHVTPTVRKLHVNRQRWLKEAAIQSLDGSDFSRQEFEMMQSAANEMWIVAKHQAIEAAMGI